MNSLRILHVGCGHRPKLNTLNLDARTPEECGVELGKYLWVQADFTRLPFQDESFDELVTNHTIEHVSHLSVSALVREWARVLKIGARATIVCPNAESYAKRILENKKNPAKQRQLLALFWGGQEYPGNFHYNGFTPGSLELVLKKAGFGDFYPLYKASYSIRDAAIKMECVRVR